MGKVLTMIPFNTPYFTGREHEFLLNAMDQKDLSGDGPYTKSCQEWLENNTLSPSVLLTHSCTSALEMAAELINISPGDEIIMPSFTFVSTANAFVGKGGIPVFVDIRADTLNIDENLIAAAITQKTKAIVVVHYAGVACNMGEIKKIGDAFAIPIIEDAAQGIMSTYNNSALGSIGDLGCISFHQTKNISSGEGGALLINNPQLIERAEIIRQKGTNRKKFLDGVIEKYTWIDRGSSYLPSELISAFLLAQLESAEEITALRMSAWNYYHDSLKKLEDSLRLKRPSIPGYANHNAHIYYLLLKDWNDRNEFIAQMKDQGISCFFHYIPLHNSPAGIKFGRCSGELPITEKLSSSLVRLPLWPGVDAQAVSEATNKFLG
jgi:dTDP-4-amino-4,6-dideoxygalactose transaminase